MVANGLVRVPLVISPRAALAGMLGAAVLGVIGCGAGGNADAAKVKQTVRQALAALADGNGAVFCSLATLAAQAELTRTTPGATCPQVVDGISRRLSPEVRLGLRHARVGTVTVAGGHASIRAGEITATRGSLVGFLQSSAPPTKFARQSDGSWRISG
jgi:hypothetical protein